MVPPCGFPVWPPHVASPQSGRLSSCQFRAPKGVPTEATRTSELARGRGHRQNSLGHGRLKAPGPRAPDVPQALPTAPPLDSRVFQTCPGCGWSTTRGPEWPVLSGVELWPGAPLLDTDKGEETGGPREGRATRSPKQSLIVQAPAKS